MINYKERLAPIFFIPDLSPWPLLLRFSIANIVTLVLFWAEGLAGIYSLSLFGLIIFSLMILWCSDINHELVTRGLGSKEMDNAIKTSIIWFICREVIFFFSFFFGYTSLRLCGEVSRETLWPPSNITTIAPFSVPLLNTVILLSRGVSLTWAHHILIKGSRSEAVLAIVITLIFSIGFIFLQLFEYNERFFSINDSFYGRMFFLATGFHGLHVLVGSVLLSIASLHLSFYNTCSSGNHVFFEIRSWYWHFVDVVWLFLFLVLYCNVMYVYII